MSRRFAALRAGSIVYEGVQWADDTAETRDLGRSTTHWDHGIIALQTEQPDLEIRWLTQPAGTAWERHDDPEMHND